MRVEKSGNGEARLSAVYDWQLPHLRRVHNAHWQRWTRKGKNQIRFYVTKLLLNLTVKDLRKSANRCSLVGRRAFPWLAGTRYQTTNEIRQLPWQILPGPVKNFCSRFVSVYTQRIRDIDIMNKLLASIHSPVAVHSGQWIAFFHIERQFVRGTAASFIGIVTEQVTRPAPRRLYHPSQWRPLEACCRPWTRCRNDAMTSPAARRWWWWWLAHPLWAKRRRGGLMFCCCFIFYYILVISFRPIISASTGSIFAKFPGLVELWQQMNDLSYFFRSLKGRCRGN